MAGITGKNSLSIKKLDVQESKVPAIGFNKIRFMHKAVAGETEITLSALTTPSEATANGFVQPSISVLNSLHLAQFRENFQLKSSLRGDLQEYLAYRLVGANKITLLFEAEEGEIFTGIMDHNPRIGQSLVDGAPLVVTGVLSAGDTDFNVGTPFQVGMFPSAQHGVVMVLVEGQLAYRNTGNNPPGPGVAGDYYEVHAGGGLGTIVRFNTPDLVNDRQISVISVGALIERPNGSQLALIEAVQGELDTHRDILEELTETTITPGAPSSVDLKAFGDRVLQAETDIDALQSVAGVTLNAYSLLQESGAAAAGYGSTNTRHRKFVNVFQLGTDTQAVQSSTLGDYIEVLVAGLYEVSANARSGAGTETWVITRNHASNTFPSASERYQPPHGVVAVYMDQTGAGTHITGSKMVYLSVGDKIRLMSSTASVSVTNPEPQYLMVRRVS